MGITVESFSGDILRGNDLGILPAWMTRALWCLFGVDAFRSRASTKEDHMKHNALSLKTQVAAWYPSYEAKLPPQQRAGMTRLLNMTMGLLGSNDFKSLIGFKAADNLHFLPFVLHLVRKHASERRADGDVNYDALEQSGQCLVQWLNVANGHGGMMDPASA